MISPRRMPTLGRTQGRRIPLAPRRRAALARNGLAWAAAISAALHIAVIAALIITFPAKPPPEAALPTGIQVVFESGAKTKSAPAAKQGPTEKAQEAAPRGPKGPTPSRVAEAAPPLPPPPASAPAPPPPAPPPPQPVAPPSPPHEVTPPPPAPQPVPRPAPPPVPVPVRKPLPVPKPVRPAAPKPAPPLPLPPVPVPAAPQPAPPPPDNSQAEMNLELPPMPEFAPIPLPPPPLLPPPPARPSPPLARRSAAPRSGALGRGLVMNGLSFSGGGGSGTGGSALNMTLPSAQNPGSDSSFSVENDIGADWDAELVQWVEAHKYYPEMAGEMGQQGSVTVTFTVDRTGHVSKLSVSAPSPYALLNQAWLGVFRGAKLPAFPPGIKRNETVVHYTMQFELVPQ